MTTTRRRLSTVYRFARPHMPLFIAAEICILVSYAVSLLLPLNLTRLVDGVLHGGNHALLPNVLLTYLLLFGIMTVQSIVYAWVWQSLANRFVVDVKNEVFCKTVFAKAKLLTSMNTGDIMSRIDGDSEQFLPIVQRNLFHFVNSFILCAGIIVVVARISWQIAVILVVAATLPIIITRVCAKFTEKFTREERETGGKFNGRVFEILGGMRELRLLKALSWGKEQIVTPLKKLIALGNKVRRVDMTVNKLIYLVNLSASILIYATSVTFVSQKSLTVGMFLAIIEYVALLHRKFNWMLRIWLDWHGRKVSVDRVNEILLSEQEHLAVGEMVCAIEKIEFRNVSFAYNEDVPVLQNLSFTVKKGEHVAIVGASGAGKTTLVSLLLGLYQPNSGEILINGTPLEKIALGSLRKALGVVSQDIRLFDESVEFNLNFGNESGSREVEDALKKAKIYDVISTLPEGIETRIGTEQKLSGGQLQRIMLARAFLKEVNTFVLDEATSALDVKTEESIISELAKDENATLIVISHRQSVVERMDRVVQL